MDRAQVKLIVEKHADGYVAYPLGLKGVVVGQGDTYEDAVADVKSAIAFHIETFGSEVFEADEPPLEVCVAEAGIALSSGEPRADGLTPPPGRRFDVEYG